jgi:group I intron endonuclease
MKDNQHPSSKSLVYTVYKLTNTVTGKSYIGLTTVGLQERWIAHQSRARLGVRKSRIYVALAKFGTGAFRREVLAETVDREEGERLEAHFIGIHDTYRNGYNSNLGGTGFFEFPEEIRRKISEAQKGKIISAESRARMSLAKLGDKRCADHFGDFTAKGSGNPKAKSFLIQFPDGSENIITGLREFCRQHKLTQCKLSSKGRTKGYVILKRFNDHPAREYGQAAGKGEAPPALQG